MDEIIKKLIAFRDARNWQQFHTVKNLIMAITSEAGELAHAVRWSDGSTEQEQDAIRSELADIMIFILYLYSAMGMGEKEILGDINLKIYLNGLKYPASCSEKELTKLNNGV